MKSIFGCIKTVNQPIRRCNYVNIDYLWAQRMFMASPVGCQKKIDVINKICQIGIGIGFGVGLGMFNTRYCRADMDKTKLIDKLKEMIFKNNLDDQPHTNSEKINITRPFFRTKKYLKYNDIGIIIIDGIIDERMYRLFLDQYTLIMDKPEIKDIKIVIRTLGGSGEAMEKMKTIINNHPGNISCYLHEYSLSAGTIMAFSCNKIISKKNYLLGPIDVMLENDNLDTYRDETNVGKYYSIIYAYIDIMNGHNITQRSKSGSTKFSVKVDNRLIKKWFSTSINNFHQICKKRNMVSEDQIKLMMHMFHNPEVDHKTTFGASFINFYLKHELINIQEDYGEEINSVIEETMGTTHTNCYNSLLKESIIESEG